MRDIIGQKHDILVSNVNIMSSVRDIRKKHDILVSNVNHIAMKLSEIYYWTEA